jgi:hypothetical protein
MDCLAHYDRVYDLAVYGLASETNKTPPAAKISLSADEIVGLFDELGVHPARRRSASPSLVMGIWLKLSSASAAARLWLVYQWCNLIDGPPEITQSRQHAAIRLRWDDYAELIDLAAAGTSAQNAAPSSPWVYRTHVLFGDCVRHSAASPFDGWMPVFGHRIEALAP